ncbi:MAG: cereblon family protein [Myxococcales bacterium]
MLRGERQEAPDIGGVAALDPLWRCAACGHGIARNRILLDGAEARAFVNPAGVEYVIGGFREAPGCALSGEPSSWWSWFPGFAWQVAGCGNCGVHLGWSFTGADERFYGLILDRLIAPSA